MLAYTDLENYLISYTFEAFYQHTVNLFAKKCSFQL